MHVVFMNHGNITNMHGVVIDSSSNLRKPAKPNKQNVSALNPTANNHHADITIEADNLTIVMTNRIQNVVQN